MTEQFRTIPYDADALCESCGDVGAYDFYGDYYCPACLSTAIEERKEEMEEVKYDIDND